MSRLQTSTVIVDEAGFDEYVVEVLGLWSS